jgi:23S rRNA (cytidine1920-2'-O)/16S rRNA (cytidine1409-2'-O)-methyltransferase
MVLTSNAARFAMKKRLDILVAEKFGLSRSRAQALIMAGTVLADGKPVTKSGTEIEEGTGLELKEIFPYVSRGALKLKQAVEHFGINLDGKIVADIGASTGGFTDYALQAGARKVYAIDTGRGQIAQKLRDDKRVILFESTNIRSVVSLPEPIDIFVIDVSFISLKKVLPQILKISQTSNLKPLTCDVVALIKPQFEVGKAIADKFRGVIKDDATRQKVVDDITDFAKNLGYEAIGTIDSPITGAKGNKEFLLYLSINKKTKT